jgi:pathogenesis-related protein 1
MKKKISCSLPFAKFISILFFLVASFGFMNGGAQTDKPVTIPQILDAHNAYRTEVGVPALTWSDDLAKFAQDWANELALNRSCQLSHRPDDENDPWNQKYGENIYLGGGSNWTPTVLDAVASWGEEKKDFDVNTKNCKDGSVCGHYTQMIWKNTNEVGCGISVCPDGNVIVVCNYNPSGNWVGETPY